MAIFFNLLNLKACELHGKLMIKKEIYHKVKEHQHLMILDKENLIFY